MHLDINGVTYHLEVAGQGPTLLLLHGFTGSAETWRMFLPKWSRYFQVAAVDLLGHGRTSAPADGGRYSTEHAVRDLAAILDALRADRAHVLGYSMGGRLALSLAVMVQQRVRSLILAGSSPGLPTKEERDARRKSDEELADRIEREGIERFVEYWENLPLFRTMRSLPEDVQIAVRKQRLACNPQGLAGSLRGMGTGAQPSWWEHLAGLRMPVQLICGELDEKFVSIARRMHERLPDSRLAVVPQAGHAAHVEQPDIFDTIVLDFLRSIGDASPNGR